VARLERTDRRCRLANHLAVMKSKPKPGQKVSAKRLAEMPVHALGFTLDELREARLAPIVDFKGREAPLNIGLEKE
jgi:hypothetical protein